MLPTRLSFRSIYQLFAVCLLCIPANASAQDPDVHPATPDPVFVRVETGAEDAGVVIEFANKDRLELAVRDGLISINGTAFRVAADSALEHSWRALLESLAVHEPSEIVRVLVQWSPPEGSDGERIASALRDALPRIDPVTEDSIARLNRKIADLEGRLDHTVDELRNKYESKGRALIAVRGFLHRVGMVVYAAFFLLLAIGIGIFVPSMAPNRLQTIADRIQAAPIRSGLVGLAALFLTLPAYIMVGVALVFTIVGIPLLFIWLPAVPFIVMFSLITGWFVTAFVIGRKLSQSLPVDTRWLPTDPHRRSTVLGILFLLGFLFLANLCGMFGLYSVQGILTFLGSILGWFAALAGLGGMLLSRGGTRSI